MVFALFLATELATDRNRDPASFGRAPISLGYNLRTRKSRLTRYRRCGCGRRNSPQARTRCGVGWLLRLLR